MLKGKRALITGVASERSIAWGTASAMVAHGAEVALAIQPGKMVERANKLVQSLGDDIPVYPCDVSDDASIDALIQQVSQRWAGGLDILVHSVAFAGREQLQGDYHEAVDRAGFAMAHDISSYSLSALAKAAKPLMEERNAAIVAMSYIGSEKAIPGYNVMGIAKASLEASVRYLAMSLGKSGIRINALSSGPIRTLAASGIRGFASMLDSARAMTALKRNVSIKEVGNTAAFLCSDLASGITGTVVYVDCGFSAMGLSEEVLEALKNNQSTKS